MKISWLAEKIKCQQINGNIFTISSFNDDAVYWTDGNWVDTSTFVIQYYPIDRKVLPRSVPKWLQPNLEVAMSAEPTKKRHVTFWDRNQVFFRDGNHQNLIILDSDRVANYLIRFPEPKVDCTACWDNY